jgi:hypothetical protein
MPDKRYKVEGRATIVFEVEIPESELEGWGSDPEEEVCQQIENDVAGFFYEGGAGNITYREDSVEIESCYELEPDWGNELKEKIDRANKKVLNEIVDSLPIEAKKKIVLAIDGEDDEDDD